MRVSTPRRRSGGQHPTREIENRPFQLSFNVSLKIDFQGSRVTSDGGLILVRESVYGRLAGYEDVNDAERLSQDPTFRLIGSEKLWERGAALTSRLKSFETAMLAEEQNFAGLARINRELIGRVEGLDSSRRVVLDMDSTEIPVYGQQEESAYEMRRFRVFYVLGGGRAGLFMGRRSRSGGKQ